MSQVNAGQLKRAGIYLRISEADDDLGVRRHEKLCREKAKTLGWSIIGVYEDNSISAFSGALRPRYQQMLYDVRSGHINSILAFSADRLHRTSAENIGFLRIASETGLVVHTITGGPLDMITAGGQLNAKIVVDIAEYESALKRERVKAKMDELHRAGKFTGGRRPFGLTDLRAAEVPQEASLIREAAKDIIERRPMAAIVKEWTTAGVTTINGNPWTITKLKDLMVRNWTRGLTPDGSRATWPQIIDDATAQRLDAILLDPKRKKLRPDVKRHLLTAILRCGKAHGSMGSGNANGKRCYVCKTCFLRVKAEDAEIDVANRLMARLEQRKVGLSMSTATEPTADEDQLQALKSKEDELADMLGRDELDRAAYRRAKDQVEIRKEEIRGRIVIDLKREDRRRVQAEAFDLVAVWNDLTTARKRQVLDAYIDHITVRPARRGQNYYDPKRLVVTWRES